MNLKQYFKDEPYGAKKEMAEYLGITPTWLGLLLRQARQPSAALAKKIEKATQGLVKAKELRPDLFD
jgi:DNA-binding transcriptional regulator YdaS (Cro superfamily)